MTMDKLENEIIQNPSLDMPMRVPEPSGGEDTFRGTSRQIVGDNGMYWPREPFRICTTAVLLHWLSTYILLLRAILA